MKETIQTPGAPAPIGPYSQGVKAGGFIFVSGQIALDPATGNLVPGNIEQETKLVMTNLHAILEAAGSGFDKVVKATIFLKSMDDFPKVNAVYGGYFQQDPPARETVEVSRLPKNVNVEISVIALV